MKIINVDITDTDSSPLTCFPLLSLQIRCRTVETCTVLWICNWLEVSPETENQTTRLMRREIILMCHQALSPRYRDRALSKGETGCHGDKRIY